MNRTKDVETTLHSWAPRRPSSNLERRIFESPSPALDPSGDFAGADPVEALNWSWLAPVTAALLVFCGLSTHHNPVPVSSGTETGWSVALALSNQSAATWLPESHLCDQNRISGENFEWTNRGHSTSSMRSLSGFRSTN
jgi:hypothetical protein